MPVCASVFTCLQNRLQEIDTYESMIESVADRGSMLGSANVQSKLGQLRARFADLQTNAHERVKQCELMVDGHQQFQDQLQHANDWLQMHKTRLASLENTANDMGAIEARLEKLATLLNALDDGEDRLQTVRNAATKTCQQTAEDGQKLIQREVDWLTQGMAEFREKLQDSNNAAMGNLGSLDEFSQLFECLKTWIRETEPQFNEKTLYNTLDEKKTCLEKLEVLLDEIDSREEDFANLDARIENMHQLDSRLASQGRQIMTRFGVLQSQAKEVVMKWDQQVVDHEAFQENHDEFVEILNSLLAEAEECSDAFGRNDDLEKRLERLHELQLQKENFTERFHQILEQGERLYPYTAPEGREEVRKTLRNLHEVWETLGDSLSESQRVLDNNLQQKQLFDSNAENLRQWITETREKLSKLCDNKENILERRSQLQAVKALYQDVISKHYAFASLAEKSAIISDPRGNEQVDLLTSRYEDILEQTRKTLQIQENALRDHIIYTETVEDCQQWLTTMQDKLASCGGAEIGEGDRLELEVRLTAVKDLAKELPDGEEKLNAMTEISQVLQKSMSTTGQEVLIEEHDTISKRFHEFNNGILQTLSDLEVNLADVVQQEKEQEELISWIKSTEQQARLETEPRATEKEKHNQAEQLAQLVEQTEKREFDVENFVASSMRLLSHARDTRKQLAISQIQARFTALVNQVRQQADKTREGAFAHTDYNQQQKRYREWLVNAEERLVQVQSLPSRTHEEAESRLRAIDALLEERARGETLLQQAQQAGERLLGSTAAQGREKVRQELRADREDLESIVNQLEALQNGTVAHLTEFEEFEDTQRQLTKWFAACETQLKLVVQEKDNQEEKRTQAFNAAALLQDIIAHQRAVEHAMDKAHALRSAGEVNDDINQFVHSANHQYEILKSKAKVSSILEFLPRVFSFTFENHVLYRPLIAFYFCISECGLNI